MPPLSRYEYKQILDIVEEKIIHTDATIATPELVQQLTTRYDVTDSQVYAVISIEYPTYYPEEFKRELKFDADRMKSPTQIIDTIAQKTNGGE